MSEIRTKEKPKYLVPPKSAHRKLSDEAIRKAVEAVVARRKNRAT